MKCFTVLLLLPDYVATEFGHETYLAHVEARHERPAVRQAQLKAALALRVTTPEDFHVLFLCQGHVEDLKARVI